MSATNRSTMPRHGPADGPPARLALKDAGASRGFLDGAWWPRSRDLSRELPALAGVLDPLWGRVTRVVVHPRYWPAVPRKVSADGHVVRVGGFAKELDPHKMVLLSYTAGRWDLLVIPPDTDEATAARLMAAASGTGPEQTASALMAAEETLSAAPDSPAPDPGETWESEGGAGPPQTAPA